MTHPVDQHRIRRAFGRAAAGFENADFLHREIRDRLLSRLPIVKIEPERVLDLGAGTGGATENLLQAFPASQVVALDFSKEMLAEAHQKPPSKPVAAICADARSLPIAANSIDLIFSNLLLQHCPDPLSILKEARRVLRFPGLFTFTTLGPNSLVELGEAWAAADNFSHIAPVLNMHDLGDALVHVGFLEPVMYSEKLTITYESLARAIADLRGVGSINATSDRNRGLTGRHTWQRLTDGYEQCRNADGKLPVTVEIIYGLAWAGEHGTGVRNSGGEFEIPVDELRLISRN